MDMRDDRIVSFCVGINDGMSFLGLVAEVGNSLTTTRF
jgi:hypothetical protein